MGLNEILKVKNGTKYLANLGEIKKEYTSLIGFQESNLNKISDVQLIFEETGFKSGTIKSNLEMIGAELSEKVQKQINDQLNSVIYDRMKKINSRLDNIKNLLKKVKLSENNVYQVKVGSKMSLSLGTSSHVISKVASLKERTLDKTVYLNFKDNKLQLDFDSSMGIDVGNIDELFNNLRHNIGSLDKNTQYVVKNFSTLKEQYVEYERLLSLQIRTAEIIKYIEKDFDLKRSFKELIDTLKKVYSEFKEKTDKLEKKLRECEFEKIVKSVYHEQLQQLGEKEKSEFLVAKYAELSEQYRAAFNSNDTATAKRLKQEMDGIYENASQEDRKRMDASERLSKIHEEDKARKYSNEQGKPSHDDLYDELREYAIYELKKNPPTEYVEEVVNGDIKKHYFDNSNAIDNRIEEYIKISKMSPIQRGLYLTGEISFKKEEDLTVDEISYYNTHYSDDALPYVKICKKIEKRNEAQQKVNSIYRDYIRAKVSGYNKPFSSYVEEMASVIGLNPEMVDESMLEKAIEKGGGIKR